MNRLWSGFCAAALLAAAGCASAPMPPADRRVTVAENLGTDVFVTDVRCVKGSGGFLTFQANVVNNTRSELPVDWKVQWLDGDGLEIESAACGWQGYTLSPKDIKGLSGTAPQRAAADMRFYVRRGR